MDFPTFNCSSDQTLSTIQVRSILHRTYYMGQQSFYPLQIHSPSDFDPLQQSRIFLRHLLATLPPLPIGSR